MTDTNAAPALLDEIISVIEDQPEGSGSVWYEIENPIAKLADAIRQLGWNHPPIAVFNSREDAEKLAATLPGTTDDLRTLRGRVINFALDSYPQMQFFHPDGDDNLPGITIAQFRKMSHGDETAIFNSDLKGDHRKSALAALKAWKRRLSTAPGAGSDKPWANMRWIKANSKVNSDDIRTARYRKKQIATRRDGAKQPEYLLTDVEREFPAKAHGLVKNFISLKP